MTYCVGLKLNDGLIMMADTRTNAGLDNIATFRKLTVIEKPGERIMGLMTAGNLAVSQAIVSLITEQGIAEPDSNRRETLYTVPSMLRAAQLVGRAVREVYKQDGATLEAQSGAFVVSILLGGQVRHGQTRLFQIYTAGNFIEATSDTPFLQIGEHKYGKPILDRVATPEIDVADGLKLCMISMDSTIRSNLSVGLPIDILVCRKDGLEAALNTRITEDDPYFSSLRKAWSDSLSQAYRNLPSPEWGI